MKMIGWCPSLRVTVADKFKHRPGIAIRLHIRLHPDLARTAANLVGFAARGFRQFLLRGIEKVQGEWSLVCTTHNILKLYRLYG